MGRWRFWDACLKRLIKLIPINNVMDPPYGQAKPLSNLAGRKSTVVHGNDSLSLLLRHWFVHGIPFLNRILYINRLV